MSMSEDGADLPSFPRWKVALAVAVPAAAAACIGAYLWYRHKSAKRPDATKAPIGGTGVGKVDAKPSLEDQGYGGSSSTAKATVKSDENGIETPLEAARAAKNKGNKYFKAGKYREAIEHYSEALRVCPVQEREDLAAFYQNRAAAYEQLSKKEVDEEGCIREVIGNCTEALKLNPRYVKALQRRAKAAQRLSEFRLALRDLTAVCLLEGFKNPEPVKSADQVLKEVGRQKARESFKNRSKDLPSLSYITHYLDCFLSYRLVSPETLSEEEKQDDGQPGLGDYWDAVSMVFSHQYERIVETCDSALGKGLTARLPDALLLKATFLSLGLEHERAMDDFGKVLEMEDIPINVRINALLKRGSVHLLLDDEKAAQSDFQEAVKLDPRDPDVYFHRAQFNVASNRLEEATNDFERVLTLNDNYLQAHVQLAYTQYKLAFITQSPIRVEEAVNSFESALKKFHNSFEVCNVFAQVLLDKQEPGRAREMFDKAISLEPGNPTPLVHKGLLLLQVDQDIEGCIEMIRKAMELDPKCDFAYETLAAIEMQRGNVDQAIELFYKATELARSEAEMAQTFSLIEAAEAQKRVTSELGLSFAPHLAAGQGQAFMGAQ